MPKWRLALSALLFIALFLEANRAAYKGYFHDDDLDNATWTTYLNLSDFAQGLITPAFARNNFRPVGHFFFRVLGSSARLHFGWYVAALQTLHLLNVALLWVLLRRLKFTRMVAFAAVFFFAFHSATFSAYWQPMYVFDVLCATFSILSLIALIDRRWVLSFLFYWLAYKSKELAVMLPLVLAAYEFWLGEKKWKPLVPFFLVSLSFGVQALLVNLHTNDAYSLHFSLDSARKVFEFYAGQFALLPWGFLLFVPLLFMFPKDRRLRLGFFAALVLLLPLLALPSRVYSVYLYVPLSMLTILVAAVIQLNPRIVAPIFLAIWIPATYIHMREYRKSALTLADENRRYVQTLSAFLNSAPATRAYVYDGHPATLGEWGISGAVRMLTGRSETHIASAESPEMKNLIEDPNVAILNWDSSFHKLNITRRDPAMPFLSYVKVDREMPVWQFQDGWFPRENHFRWTNPIATAKVLRPSGAKAFEVFVNMSPLQIQEMGKATLSITLDGHMIGAKEFTVPGWQTLRLPLDPAPPGVVLVQFRCDPPYHSKRDSRTLGFALGSFGFVE